MHCVKVDSSALVRECSMEQGTLRCVSPTIRSTLFLNKKNFQAFFE
ncbi:hypothetical protein T4B_4324 [Trichinella pseudospiralis]|uniref:Uncharacterized protein n=1 Tax=Trichinella pseudospiralis TaxID=6337 RepID=A0A0V1GFV4_TRIPS|nr:hypothetical protein T4B_4324 [Trichinella pseudospiralis]KRY97095.1 hypothetical protein T4C_11251 [Trichinella pseudospiralis]